MKRKVLFLALAAFFCLFTVRAQDHSSIHSLMDFEAMEFIGNLAHPTQEVLDAEYVKGTSSYIDIKIKFSSIVRNYWEPYRINLKQYNGITYAYSIVKTKPSHDHIIPFDFSPSIIRSAAVYMQLSELDNDEAILALYGVSVSELADAQKAAIMLMNYIYGD